MALSANADAALIVSDDFESYANTAALQAAWPGASALGTNFDPTPAPLATQPNAVTTNLARINNAVASRSFTAFTGVDWTLDLDVLSEAYARSQAFGLLDAAGVNGYLVRWNTTNVDQNSGRGLVVLYRRGDSANTVYAAANYNQYTGATGTATGAQLGGTANSGHPVTGYPVTALGATPSNADQATYGSWAGFAHMQLAYTASTKTLKLSVDGVQLLSQIDANYTTFGKIVLSGNTFGDFDNVTLNAAVSVPEPATVVAFGSAGLLLARRRRQA
ncbi:MAG: PEP-CTERM sorting domain-containing protein [Tepidisphaeraceae bacterium]